MHIPALADFKRAAENGNLLPVYREILADGLTPVSAYAALGKDDHSFLLESVVGGEKWAAYSFIGVAPRAVIRVSSGEAHVVWYDVDGTGAAHEARWKTTDPTAALAEVMGAHKPIAPPGLPRFWGGAVGWLSYDAVRSFESLPARAPDDLGVPELAMVLTDTLIIFDNLRQTIKVVATPFVPRKERAADAYAGAIARIDSIIDKLRTGAQRLRPMAPPATDRALDGAGIPAWQSSFPEADFLRAVHTIKEYILAGDIFQAVLSQRLAVPRAGIDTFDAYRALRVLNPSPYMFHLKFPEAEVTGASPETLVRLSDGVVDLRPIAGTRARGASAAADAALEAELLADPKERAEHLMLLDLGRNDVGRVAATGTVAVLEKMRIERYSHVMHMVSSVRGQLDDGLGWADVLRAAFPAGTLSGAPKIRAMEIIDELEPHRRGIYGGGAGYVSYTGNMDLAIAIRTLIACGDSIFVQAGAGVVHDSDPASEYRETLNKANAVLRAVGAARG
ncbi:MAG TPA: anthranilate synthase component I [Kofleriaceae bacterium]|nr:anthranilate synthase component I [Kofleriaceae bacterium]